MAKRYLDYEGLGSYDGLLKSWVDAHVATSSKVGMVRPDGVSIAVENGTIFVQNVDVQSFLSSYPVGSIYESSSAQNPREVYGGYWEQQPSTGCYKWMRMPPGSAVDKSAFAQAHPIGSMLAMTENPASVAGKWEELPSFGVRKWIRKE